MVAVLFARKNSVYKSIPGCDVFDVARDARTYLGTAPVIAHPPCRGWGRLRHFAKVRPDELDLAHFAIAQVRRCGGVLEHPWASSLWTAANLPAPGQFDQFGGFTFGVMQGDFGHSAPKATWLYIVGLNPSEIPAPAFELGEKTGRVENMGKAQREATPLAFATSGLLSWLAAARWPHELPYPANLGRSVRRGSCAVRRGLPFLHVCL